MASRKLTSVPVYRCVLRKERTLRVAEPKLKHTHQAVAVARQYLADSPCERMIVLHLNSALTIVGLEQVGQGGTGGIAVKPCDVFRGAVAAGATGVIIAHNHPSGSPEPSGEDVRFTRAIVQAGRALGILVYDHIIVAREGCKSLNAQCCSGEFDG